jgi:hypothetical protein
MWRDRRSRSPRNGADDRRVALLEADGATRVDLEQSRDLRAGELLAPRDVLVGRGHESFAFERVADEGAPVVSGGIAGTPALDLLEVRGQVVGEMDLRGLRRGEEDVMKRRPSAEDENRLAGRGLLHRVGEESDRFPLVWLDNAVVVGQVLLRHPVRVEGRTPRATQEPARHASEDELVGRGPEVRAREEDQRIAGRDSVGKNRGAERAGVIGRLLGELGGDVASARREPLRARPPPPGELEGGL